MSKKAKPPSAPRGAYLKRETMSKVEKRELANKIDAEKRAGNIRWDDIGPAYGFVSGDACRKFCARRRARLEPHEAKTVAPAPPRYDDLALALKDLPNEVRGVFLADLHMPYEHDQDAIDLALQIVADFKPHIIVLGGDIFDLSNISHFRKEPSEIPFDAIKLIEKPFSEFMQSLKKAAPKAIVVFLMGNHEGRLEKFLIDNAVQFRETVRCAFANVIKSSGALWLGFNAGACDIFHLRVLHGRTAQKYTAAAHLREIGCDCIAGHTHKPEYRRKGFHNRSVQSVVSGCLCNLQPPYLNHNPGWAHGITLFTLERKEKRTHIENIVFTEYSAMYGGKVYKA